jgi:hypothetical protein
MSFEFRNAVKNKCCITDVMIDIFVVVILNDLKRGCVLACGMTSFDFRIAVENTCCITDVD